MEYKEVERKCAEIRKANAIQLDHFKTDMQNLGLAKSTIDKHVLNVGFYLNTYLLRIEPLDMLDGTKFENLNDFLGHFFINKCMWASPFSLKGTATSIRRFYKYMSRAGSISELDYKGVDQTIKEGMGRLAKNA